MKVSISTLSACAVLFANVGLVQALAGQEPRLAAYGGGGSIGRLTDRRALVTGLIASATVAAGFTTAWFGSGQHQAAYAVEMPTTDGALLQSPQDVYFGVGCFWHIQHEFVQAERERLGRKDNELTSKAGYAGGTSVGQDGKVCYHNLQMVADYGKLGHGEVVGLTLPPEEIVPFTEFYLSLFNSRTKDRVDPQDRGAEYRSLLGIPGGTKHAAYPAMEAAAARAGFSLVPGKGNDPDTLGKQIVFVYDTAKFPFHQGEIYHQFHNDFQSPPYGKAYNSLADQAYEDGRLKITGCPDRV